MQTAILLVFERVGERLEACGVSEHSRFNVASALLNYLLGAAGQHAAAARVPPTVGRTDFLQKVAEDWTSRGGPEDFPFVHAMARQLARHSDRRQFTASLDLILVGAAAGSDP